MKYLLGLFVVMLFLTSCQIEEVTVAQCLKPTQLEIVSASSNSATIVWLDTNETSTFSIEYGFSGFSRGTGTTLITTTSSVSLLDLLPNTSYDVYVKADCSVTNFSLWSDVLNFTTSVLPVIAEFRTNLSELNLYLGDLKDLNPSTNAFEYDLVTPLFTDYAYKQRLIALPPGETMEFNGDGLPIFPDNTVIAKTFYYNNDDRDLSLGRKIIETRILIKTNGEWITGDYKWNSTQTEAILDLQGSDVPVTWIDSNGITNSITYSIPSNTDCFTCHSSFNNVTPIGPKLRTLNFVLNGENQLQKFIDNQQLSGISNSSQVTQLPDWSDNVAYTLEERARAYMDVNCAHCHISGGFCEAQSTLDLAYETSLVNSNIVNRKNSILSRISTYFPGVSMPFIGTTILHDEGVELLQSYLDTL